jgi:hypothetical protein
MTSMRSRTLLLIAVTALLPWTLQTHVNAQTTPDVMERFTFMPPDAPETTVDPEGPFELILHRWSTDEERDALHESVTKMGGKDMLQALRGSGNVGRIEWPGGLTYNVRYARQATAADGGVDVVLVTDRPIWVWWDEAGVTPTTDYPFTVLQLRMSDGTGHGRSSLTTAVQAEPQTGVALGNEATTAIVMNDVRQARADG